MITCHGVARSQCDPLWGWWRLGVLVMCRLLFFHRSTHKINNVGSTVSCHVSLQLQNVDKVECLKWLIQHTWVRAAQGLSTSRQAGAMSRTFPWRLWRQLWDWCRQLFLCFLATIPSLLSLLYCHNYVWFALHLAIENYVVILLQISNSIYS